MSDSPLEEMEHREHAEHAEHAAHEKEKNPLLAQVTFTIAVLAVVAAISASLETSESDAAISAKNYAVLAQDQATDQWSFSNSKGVRKKLYEIAGDQGGKALTGPGLGFAKSAAKEGADEADARSKAQAFETKRDAALEQGDLHEQRHGRLTVASTLLHMAIAIATLAIILSRKWPWFAALGLSAAGFAAAAWAYL